jgi:NADH:ubiquinone oxidoreductase subunit 3 (subunit A)
MRFPDILLSPPIVFLIFLAACFLLFWLGGKLAPKSTDVGDKLEPYACGEDMPDNAIQINYRLFFYIALFFTIMHVSVLVVATVPAGALALLAVPYLLMISLSVAALVTRN